MVRDRSVRATPGAHQEFREPEHGHGGCSLNGHGISTLNIQVFGGGPLYCFRALRGGRPVVAAPIIVTGGMPTEGPARCTVLRGKRGRFHTVVAKVAGVIRSFSLEEVPGPD